MPGPQQQATMPKILWYICPAQAPRQEVRRTRQKQSWIWVT